MEEKRALLSVYDKSGLVEFADGLVELGFEIISSGGTHGHLQDAGITSRDISELTGFSDLLDGRVKTLHPVVYAGILSRDTAQDRKALEGLGIVPFRVVAVNLYPFQKTVADPRATMEMAMEQVDIGGVSLLRAASKAHHRCYAVCDPDDYSRVLEVLRSEKEDDSLRMELAVKAFAHTMAYDGAIADFLSTHLGEGELPPYFVAGFERDTILRYGENPHQRAALYLPMNGGRGPVAGGRKLSGREISYNNYCDLESAYALVQEFDRPAGAVIKHANPCGCAVADSPAEALKMARAGDPVSAFGGIIATNRTLDVKVAGVIVGPQGFFEAVVAPKVTPKALEMIRNRKGWGERIIVVEASAGSASELYPRWIEGGLLLSDADRLVVEGDKLQVVTKQGVSDEQMADLIFAFTVVKHVRSNAITIAREGMLLGMGGGQPNRILSVQLALQNAEEQHGGCEGAVLASDAFFPMPDAPTLAAKAGIRAIIQPGGSVKDGEVIRAMDELGVAMVFTGIRHFRH